MSLLLATSLIIATANAAEVLGPEPGSSVPPFEAIAPCAVLEDFDGQTQILDSSRAYLVDTHPKAGIACGGWISVLSGWARVRHRDGHRVFASPGTFVQIAPETEKDSFSLYRGQLLLQAGNGSGEARVLTANARVRMTRGRAIVIYSENDEETQVVAVDDTAYLENRFESERGVRVRTGEATSLNQKAMRVIPTAPKAVALADLRAKLRELHLPEKEVSLAVRSAREAQERKLGNELTGGGLADGKGTATVTGRKPAGMVFDPKAYVRHRPSEQDSRLRDHLADKLVAGDAAGRRMLFPDRHPGRPRPAKVIVEDPSDRLERKRKTEEDHERARLIDELSRIRGD